MLYEIFTAGQVAGANPPVPSSAAMWDDVLSRRYGAAPGTVAPVQASTSRAEAIANTPLEPARAPATAGPPQSDTAAWQTMIERRYGAPPAQPPQAAWTPPQVVRPPLVHVPQPAPAPATAAEAAAAWDAVLSRRYGPKQAR